MKKFLPILQFILGVFVTGLVICLISLYLVGTRFQEGLFASFFQPQTIFYYNLLPILLCLVFLAFLTGSLKASILTNSIFWLVLSYVHVLKIHYRQEPLYASDVRFLREAGIMAQKYSLELDSKFILLVLGIFLILYAWSSFFDRDSLPLNFPLRIFGSLAALVCMVQMTGTLLFDDGVYRSLGQASGLNTWQELNNYASKGFSYPLIYSLKTAKGYVYPDYDEARAKDLVSKGHDENIPQGQKVNFICIMLESYKDFYKYQNPKMVFTENPYAYWYDLQKESIHGNLYVNTFGGGTILSEMCFWSGYRNSPIYNVPRYTYVSYFKDQGYKTQAFHPSDGLFNNRHNIYPKVGFDDFFYSQDYFDEAVHPGVLSDEEFFPELLKIFKDQAKNDQPYFSWSISYQGHGPYPDSVIGKGRVFVKKQEGYDESQWFAFNNYLQSVKETSDQLRDLVDGLREEEPTVLILFGDHSPSMGDQVIGMKMMGIPSDLSTVEGMQASYETPYMIWANPKAKEVFKGRTLVGKGPNLEPNFLMAYAMKSLGLKGTAFCQFSQDLLDKQTVMKPSLACEGGVWKDQLSPQGQSLYRDYLNYEYYRSRMVREEK